MNKVRRTTPTNRVSFFATTTVDPEEKHLQNQTSWPFLHRWVSPCLNLTYLKPPMFLAYLDATKRKRKILTTNQLDV